MAPSADMVKVVLGTAIFGSALDPQAKITTPEAANEILDLYRSRGYKELDTARAYPVGAKGTAEKLLGECKVGEWAVMDSKVTSWAPGAHQEAKIAVSVEESLKALAIDKLHIDYLHSPDRTTPFEETCRAMNKAFQEGKFEKFGISNFTVPEVEEVVAICEKNGWVKPSVYQGQYNPIARNHELDLLPVLRKHNISFYAFSPAAAGFFSGKVSKDSVGVAGGRWDTQTRLGQVYVRDYFKDAMFEAAETVLKAAKSEGISGHEAAVRWCLYHSALKSDYGDAIVIGSSSAAQLKQNLDIAEAGPLPAHVVQSFEDAWEIARESAPSHH